MTVWQFLTNVGNLIFANITKLLGLAQVTAAFLATSNVIPPDYEATGRCDPAESVA